MAASHSSAQRAQGSSSIRSSASRLTGPARWLIALTLGGLVCTVPLSVLAAPQAVGPPITVYNQLANLALPAEQASVDARANGDFAVAWIDDVGAVRVQRYGTNGVAQTAALVAAVGPVGVLRNRQPDVAMGEDGSMVVVWEQGTAVGFASDVYYRRVLPSGALSGLAPVRVAAGLISVNRNVQPAVAAGVDGRFVVAWQRTAQGASSSRISARRYTVTGNAATVGAEVAVSAASDPPQAAPDVAMDARGAYAIVWIDLPNGSPTGADIHIRRFDASGAATLPEHRFAPFAVIIGGPAVALNAAGDALVVAWSQPIGLPFFDTQSNSVFARRFGPDFSVSELFEVSDAPSQIPFVRASADAAGRFAVLWGERKPVMNTVRPTALVRRFDTSGATLDATPFAVEADDIAMDADSDLVAVASRRIGQSLLTASTIHQNVIAQRLQGTEPVDLTATHEILSPPPSSFPANVTYRVRVSNLHPPVDLGVAPAVQNAIGAASQVVVTTNSGLNLPSGTGWTCELAFPGPRCSFGSSLAPGQTAPDLVVTRTVSPDSTPMGPNNLVRSGVSANQIDPNLTNNTVQTLLPAP